MSAISAAEGSSSNQRRPCAAERGKAWWPITGTACACERRRGARRAGLRVHEALALAEHELDPRPARCRPATATRRPGATRCGPGLRLRPVSRWGRASKATRAGAGALGSFAGVLRTLAFGGSERRRLLAQTRAGRAALRALRCGRRLRPLRSGRKLARTRSRLRSSEIGPRPPFGGWGIGERPSQVRGHWVLPERGVPRYPTPGLRAARPFSGIPGSRYAASGSRGITGIPR